MQEKSSVVEKHPEFYVGTEQEREREVPLPDFFLSCN